MAVGPDYSVTPWSWPTQSINTTATYGAISTPSQTLTGFNQTVTLRIAASSIVGTINAAGIYVIKNGNVAGSLNFIFYPNDYIDVTMQAGDTLSLHLDAQSWSGPATGSATISIRNQSDSNALVSSFTLNMAVSQ